MDADPVSVSARSGAEGGGEDGFASPVPPLQVGVRPRLAVRPAVGHLLVGDPDRGPEAVNRDGGAAVGVRLGHVVQAGLEKSVPVHRVAKEPGVGADVANLSGRHRCRAASGPRLPDPSIGPPGGTVAPDGVGISSIWTPRGWSRAPVQDQMRRRDPRLPEPLGASLSRVGGRRKPPVFQLRGRGDADRWGARVEDEAA